jgi:superfamily II DNA or RNA helicase
MIHTLNPNSIDDYRKFIAIKSLPRFSFTGREAWFPDEYAAKLGMKQTRRKAAEYKPSEFLFDYQAAIATTAIKKQRYAVFADCGLGKTAIIFEYVRHVNTVLPKSKRILIVSPLMVISQTIAEAKRFYGDNFDIQQVKAKDLQAWLNGKGDRIGITNYDAIIDDLDAGQLGSIVLDESSMLKSMYGKWGTKLIELGKGLEWKLCLTGTPAPNDRIEYGNHAVFLDQFPTLNAFLARYFVNRGQTDNRWELKPHALEPFYRSISHWAIFLSNPATYGWKDNTKELPPINVHISNVELTSEQDSLVQSTTGELFASNFGGITSRGTLARIAKGSHKGEKVATNKYAAIMDILNKEPDRPTIIWCLYNDEQETLAAMLPDAANISGDTPDDKRRTLVDDFKTGRKKVLISKGRLLGFGLNLQICTRMIFSALQDSYECYYQCVKRANRYGSTSPLDVYIPLTDLELPMVETVLRKARQIESDTQRQQEIFLRVNKGDTTNA